ncbi:HNH endonuclease [Bosea sp. LjRoot9]|uniref:HNH endonuclease n=1 Tax=Bosea sp. LjRoot9 TaxID=3342341 RepID=UPI003ECE9EFB
MPLLIKDLKYPVTVSKADWLAASTWLGFTPEDGGLKARNLRQSTIQRQFGRGYVLEYIVKNFGQPNPGFERDPDFLAERAAHKAIAGRLVGIHKLRTTSRPLEQILGAIEFKKIQDMWADPDQRWRWSVAFPIVESYSIVGNPIAAEVFGEDSYHRLYKRPSAVLRDLNDADREKIAMLEIEIMPSENAWIGIEDEFALADASPISRRFAKDLDEDFSAGAFEGIEEERRRKVRRRAVWLAGKFIRMRIRDGKLLCDECSFDPAPLFPSGLIRPRSLLDVHHKNPLDEGIRYTTTGDFALLCPTCHRVEHARLREAIARTSSPAGSL